MPSSLIVPGRKLPTKWTSSIYQILKDLPRPSEDGSKDKGSGLAEAAFDFSGTAEIMVTNTVRGKAVTDLIARCLREGSTIEIDGLGKFELQNDDVVFKPSNRIRVFLAYAQEDRRMVQTLYDELQNAGFEPWMDVAKLLPGQNWPRAIQRAIEVSDFVLINFSHRSVEKRGHFQAELRYALDLAKRVPLEDIFLVPVRLSECEVPTGDC